MTDVPIPTQTKPDRPARRSWGWLLLIPGMAWLALFFVTPTVQLVGTSLYNPLGSFEFGYQMTWHFANYSDAITENLKFFGRSFMYAGTATVICFLLSYPLAYAIAFKSGRWKNFMLVLVIAPFFTSFLLRTLTWQAILADQGPVVDVLKAVHLLGSDGRLLATPVAVIAGLTYNFLPFMTLPIYASLDKVDHRLIEASADLYATPFTGLRKVTFPLSLPGVVSGTLLTFIPACGDYINAELLGTPRQYMIGNKIQSAYLVQKDYPPLRGDRDPAPPMGPAGTVETVVAERAAAEEAYPGEALGLPESGRGSLATWTSRVVALVLDWAASMVIAVALFGTGVLTESGWRSAMVLAVFFVESALLGALAGGSLGQLLTRIAVLRLDRVPLGFVRSVARAAMVCLVLPPLIVGVHRRGLHDLAVGTAVINRR